MTNFIGFVGKYLGWRNWSVLVFNSVIENIFVFFYIALRAKIPGKTFMVDFFCFFLFSMFSTTYGYLVNDLADKELDRLHGKANTFENDSKVKASAIVLLFLLISMIFGARFAREPYFPQLWVCWAFIATFYSVKPIRLKERGKTGLLCVVIAQRLLPALTIFAGFGYFAWMDVSVLSAYIFFRGLSSDLNHQLEDYHRDASTGTRTYTVDAGFRKAGKMFRFSLEAEKILLVGCLAVMYYGLSNLKLFGVPLPLPLLLFYLLLYGLNWLEIAQGRTLPDINPFVAGRKNVFQIIHHAFPSVILPLYLLLLLAWKDWIYLLPLLFLVVYRKLYSVELVRQSLLSLRIRAKGSP